MSLSRSSGMMKLVENGKMFVNKPFAEVKASQPIKVGSQCCTYNKPEYYLPGKHLHPGLLLPA